VLSLHKTLECAAANLGRKTRPIILDDQFSIALARPEPDIDLAAWGEVNEFIFQQIAHSAIDKPEVGLDYDTASQVSFYLMMLVGHGWQVQMDQLSHDIGEVHRHAIHRKSTGFGFRNIQHRVEESRHAVQSFDSLPDRISPLLAVFSR